MVPPGGDQLTRASRMLVDEHGMASNIKNPSNRRSVINAVTSVQQKLKLYRRTPPNGLLVFCGSVVNADGKTKKVNVDLEPPRLISRSFYHCDSRFHTEELQKMLVDEDKFGFIVVDGNGALFGVLQGTSRQVVHRFSVDLPRKHGRGGQSANRYARLGQEARHNYVRKVADAAKAAFVVGEEVGMSGLILAGSADVKSVLEGSELFDRRLRSKVIKIVDVAYGGNSGFNQAIDLSADCLIGVKWVRERKLISEFFEMVKQDVRGVCFGVRDLMVALEVGAVKTILCWEDLQVVRMSLKSGLTGEVSVFHLTQKEEKARMSSSLLEEHLEMTSRELLIDWIVENYRNYGASLELISDRSPEGTQFVKGFGGVGGILRYHVDFDTLQLDAESDGEEFNLDDY